MSRAITLLSLWAFVACSGANFIFTFYCQIAVSAALRTTAFGSAHPVQIRVTNVNNNWYCRLCEDPGGATDYRRGREDKTRGTHTCDRPRGDVTLIEWTTAVQSYWMYLFKWQINCSRGKENTECTPSPSLSAVTYYSQCPFYYVPEQGSFIAYKACIRRDLPRVIVFGDMIKLTSCKKEARQMYPE